MALDPINYTTNNSSFVDFINQQNGFDTTSTNGSDAARAAADLNFETFLQLLTTQLKNQDPLNPMEDKEFTAQIAQFASLEQNIQQSDLLSKIAQQNDFSQQNLALSYIGKDALIPGNVTATDGEAGVSINYDVPSTVSSVLIEIYDEEGQVVRNMEGDTYLGRNEVVWDSLGDDEQAVEPGFYTFKVSGFSQDGDVVPIKSYTYGRVHSLEGEGENIMFTAEDGRIFTMDDVLLVRESFIDRDNGSDNSGNAGDGTGDATQEDTTV